MTPQPLNSAPPQGPVEGRGVAEIRADLATCDRDGVPWPGAARRLLADVPSLLAEVEAAHRFERSAAVEREALLGEVAELRELTDAARLLGPARRVLDMAAEGEATREECAAMAQRIVDLIGHPVTDEPPHALVERDSLRGVVAEIERLRAARDAAVKRANRNARGADEWMLRAVAAERVVQAVEALLAPGREYGSVDELGRDLDAALAVAADAPQPEEAPTTCAACGHVHTARLGGICIGCPCPGPSPAVLPEGQQR